MRRQARDLIIQIAHPLALFIDHRDRRLGDKGLIRELALYALQILLQAHQFLRDALAFNRGIDQIE